MQIRRTIERFPGGMMVIPLLLGAGLKTFAPRLLSLGSFSTALSQGAMPILAVFFVCMGAEIQLRTAPSALRKGLAITFSKLAGGICIGLLIAHLAPGGSVLGLSALAVIAAMTNANMGLYAALSRQFGQASDVGALAVLSVLEGPFLTMLALGASGLVHIPLLQLLATVLPIVAGMVLGNLDPDLRQLLSSGGTLLIPFFAFGLGAQINLQAIWAAGLSGVVLGLATLLLGGGFNLLGSRLGGGDMVAGAAVSTTAGNAVATPLAIAAVDPHLSALAALATPQIAASTVITSLLAPVFTAVVARHEQRRRAAHGLASVGVPRPGQR